ncbi:hypothetical protein D3C87_1664800 [compost metagenome]
MNDAAHPVEIDPPAFRQAQLPRRPAEQSRAERPLQPGDVLARRGRRDAELARRRGDAAFLDTPDETLDAAQSIHNDIHRICDLIRWFCLILNKAAMAYLSSALSV